LEVKDASNETYDRRTFLRFDIRSGGSSATSASLRVYVSRLPNGQPVSVCAFGVNSDTWTESGLTWRNQPVLGAMLSCQNVTATGWISFDVTSFVKEALAGDKIVSLTLQDTGTINRMVELDSREAANKPVLTIK
jgi:hypothetical protein